MAKSPNSSTDSNGETYCGHGLKDSILLRCQETRIYKGEKTVSSISGAGKTGQLHVKN